ncbi:MAG: hypothetical protein WB998_04520 [Solirubrobacteraceae bacterium]
MAATKLSIALEEPVAQAARRSAERRGISLSAWLNEASRKELAIDKGLAAVAEWEAETGLLSAEDLAAADAVLDAAGVGHNE